MSPAIAMGRPASQRVHVDADADPGHDRVAHRGTRPQVERSPRPAAGRCGSGHLEGLLRSVDHRDRPADGLDERGVVGGSPVLGGGTAVRRVEHGPAEPLRGLHRPQRRRGRRPRPVRVDPLDGVRAPAGRARRRRRCSRTAATTALDEVDGRERARRVVHQDHLDVAAAATASAAATDSCRVSRRRRRAAAPRRDSSASTSRIESTSSGGAATTTRSTDGAARRVRTACTSSGSPREQAQRLRDPGAEPLAAACGRDQHTDRHAASRHDRAPVQTRLPAIDWGRANTIRPLAVVSTLVTRTARLLADAVAGPLDDDHRAVVEVADRLAGLLARLGQQDGDLVARDDRRAQREGERVQVHDPDAGQRRRSWRGWCRG